jgi:hypothetical protein
MSEPNRKMYPWRLRVFKLLVLLAWVGASVWFAMCYAVTWGFLPIAMVYWSAVAAPLAGLTVVWLRRLGQPVSSRGTRWTAAVWAALMVIQVPLFIAADHPLWDQSYAEWALLVLFWLCVAFPLAITGWAIARVARASSAGAEAA